MINVDQRQQALGNLSVLPDDKIIKIFSLLTPADLGVAAVVNKTFNDLSSDDIFWRELCRTDLHAEPPESPKRFYQIQSDMKNGRFLLVGATQNIPDASCEPFLIGKEVRIYETPSRAYFFQQPGSSEFIRAALSQRSRAFGKWNGKFLASAARYGPHIQIREIENGHLEFRQQLRSLKHHVFLNFAWHQDELAAIAERKLKSERFPTIFHSWRRQDNQKWKLALTFKLPCRESNLEFAWNAGRLALKTDERTVDTWKINEEGNKLIPCHTINLDASLTSLTWGGKFLFAGDESGNVNIWHPESRSATKILCLPPNCTVAAFPHRIFHDVMSSNNLLFISSYSHAFGTSLSVWVQEPLGLCQKIYEISQMSGKQSFALTGSMIAVQEDLQPRVGYIKFGEEYAKIFRMPARQLASADKLLPQITTIFKRMPSSQKQRLLRAILGVDEHVDENVFELTPPKKIAEAITKVFPAPPKMSHARDENSPDTSVKKPKID